MISVVIPAFNSHATISAAIDSVLAQTLAVDEIIVIDDGSAQPLAPFLARYGSIVSCVRQKNAGAAAARNHGIELSRGKLIAFLDADDTWEPQKIGKQLAAMEQHRDVGLLASRYFKQAPGDARTAVEIDRLYLDRPLQLRGETLLDAASSIWTGTVIVRRSALGNCRFISGLEPAEDRDLWIQILADNSAMILSEPLATAVLVPESLSRRDADLGYEPMLHVIDRHADKFSSSTRRRAKIRVYRAWAAAHLSAGKPRRALRPAAARLRRQPFSPEVWWIVFKSLTARGHRQTRSIDSLRRHFEIERELADRLRAAGPAERLGLYGQVYNDLFDRVKDHPQNTRKQSEAAQRASSAWQLRLLNHFVKPDSRYLEIGAGDCRLAMDLARKARWSYGLDVSNVIAGSATQPDNFTLILSDGVKIDLPPASIDVAYSNQLMEHLHPDDAAQQLAQIRRSIAPGGAYVCITPHRFSGPHDISRYFSSEPRGFHLKEYTYRELHESFIAAGFSSTQVWTGMKGRYFVVPLWSVLLVENLLKLFPRRFRRAVTRIAPLRFAFFNVLLVGRAATGATHIVTEDHEMAVQS